MPTEKGFMAIPDTIESVSLVEGAEPAEESDVSTSDPSGEEILGTVLAIEKKQKDA